MWNLAGCFFSCGNTPEGPKLQDAESCQFAQKSVIVVEHFSGSGPKFVRAGYMVNLLNWMNPHKTLWILMSLQAFTHHLQGSDRKGIPPSHCTVVIWVVFGFFGLVLFCFVWGFCMFDMWDWFFVFCLFAFLWDIRDLLCLEIRWQLGWTSVEVVQKIFYRRCLVGVSCSHIQGHTGHLVWGWEEIFPLVQLAGPWGIERQGVGGGGVCLPPQHEAWITC